MTSEELKARFESLTGMEDAYALAKEGGYAGTMQEFEALCANAAGDLNQINLDDMDKIAGGNAITDAAESVWDWCRENPALAVGITTAVTAAVGGAIAYGVYKYNESQRFDTSARDIKVIDENSFSRGGQVFQLIGTAAPADIDNPISIGNP